MKSPIPSIAIDQVIAPSYETPYSALSDWGPLIKGRPVENFSA